MVTARITAPSPADLDAFRKEFNAHRGTLQVVAGDVRGRPWAWPLALAWLAGLAIGLSAASEHSRLTLPAAKQAAFAAGQTNGACRLWVEALSHDPTLAIGADGQALNSECRTVLSGTWPAHK